MSSIEELGLEIEVSLKLIEKTLQKYGLKNHKITIIARDKDSPAQSIFMSDDDDKAFKSAACKLCDAREKIN